MNFNEFQEAWKNEKGGQDAFTLPSVTLRKVNQPIDNIRNNMQKELYIQSAAILVIPMLPIFYKIPAMGLLAYYSLFTLLLIISVYYFSRFYQLFKKMHDYQANIKENLFELYYEIRLHIEMYKSFSFLLLPFVIFLTGIILYSTKLDNNNFGFDSAESGLWFYFLFSATFITVFMIVFTNWWVKRFYGKYADQIRKILDELKE